MLDNRLAVHSDLDDIMELVRQAQAFMKSNGLDQWQDGYPQRELFQNDIDHGSCYLFFMDGKPCGVLTFYESEDEFYKKIYDGSWLTEGKNPAAIHRIAVSSDYRGKGIASKMLSFTENLARFKGYSSLRVDTHKENKPMRTLLEKCGFIHCGTVYLDGPENPRLYRQAYEKIV